MSNVKEVTMDGVIPFSWLGYDSPLDDSDAAFLASWFLTPSSGLRIDFREDGYVANDRGGRTCMYRFSVTGQEAISWHGLDRFKEIVAKAGGTVSLATRRTTWRADLSTPTRGEHHDRDDPGPAVRSWTRLHTGPIMNLREWYPDGTPIYRCQATSARPSRLLNGETRFGGSGWRGNQPLTSQATNQEGQMQYEDCYDDDELIDGVGFSQPGSALRAATRENPRNLPCPNCGTENALTPIDQQRGYQCDACADQAERGY